MPNGLFYHGNLMPVCFYEALNSLDYCAANRFRQEDVMFPDPIEGTTEGTLVVDAAVAGWLYIEEGPIIIKIKEGLITSIDGGKEAEILKEHLANKNDANIYNIAEIGIGLNPECRLGGGVMEDEGLFGTAHIDIGSNITLGGTVHAKGHEDLMLWDPCIELDDKIVQKGKKLFL